MRTNLGILAIWGLLAFACGGSGGDSPTEPPGGGGSLAALEGKWSGTIAVNNPSNGQGSCTVDLDLVRDPPTYLGNWHARCADGQEGNGIAVVTPIVANQVLISAVGGRGQAVFGGCGWSSLAGRDANRMRGDWSTPQNCSTGSALAGRFEVTKQ